MTKVKVLLDELHMCKIPEHAPDSYVVISQITMENICDIEHVSQIFGKNHEGSQELCDLYIYGIHKQKYKFIELFVRHMIKHKLKFDGHKIKIKPDLCIQFPSDPDITSLYLDDSVQCASISVTFKFVNELHQKYFFTTIDTFFMSGPWFICIGKQPNKIINVLNSFNIKSSEEEYEKLDEYFMIAMIWNGYEFIVIREAELRLSGATMSRVIPIYKLHKYIEITYRTDPVVRIYLII